MILPPPPLDFAAARRQYLELYAKHAVLNNHLKIAVLALSSAVVCLAIVNAKTYSAYHHLQPIVIRIDQLGRAESVNYGNTGYQPQAAEIKYFLVQFTQGFYGRMRATVRESYTRSLYFLDGRLAESVMESDKKSKAIETFLDSPREEVDVQVSSVAVEDLRQTPMKATVEYEKVHYSPTDHREVSRERYVGNFVFVVKQPVPNNLIPVNPLGLTITYFREDQAFR